MHGIVAYTFSNISEKFTSFSQVLKEMHTEENWFLFLLPRAVQVYNKYGRLLVRSMHNHCLFTAALDRACQHFINHNAVADNSPNPTSKSAELIARYWLAAFVA